MNKVKSFLKLVEIRTKVASMLPLAIGTTLAVYLDGALNVLSLILMTLSLLSIDMATTGFNHYFDYKRAVLRTGYHYEKHNPVSAGEFTPEKALPLLISLVGFGVLSGLALVFRTDLVVLILGGIAFVVGIAYSAGPLPISRTILGEAFSGIFMGGLIPFIAAYIHLPSGLLGSIYYSQGHLSITFELQPILSVVFAILPLIALIGNIMLANNICDREEDIVNHRYTLPVVMGLEKSLILYKVSTMVALLSVIIAVISGFLPWPYALTLVTTPMLLKHMRRFVASPVKAKTFVYAVQNFILFASASFVGLFIATLLKILG